MNHFSLRSFLILSLLAATLSINPSWSCGIVPEFTVEQGQVKLHGVGPDNPVVYDNDWWFDVFDNNYLWAQTRGGCRLWRRNGMNPSSTGDAKNGLAICVPLCSQAMIAFTVGSLRRLFD